MWNVRLLYKEKIKSDNSSNYAIIYLIVECRNFSQDSKRSIFINHEDSYALAHQGSFSYKL